MVHLDWHTNPAVPQAQLQRSSQEISFDMLIWAQQQWHKSGEIYHQHLSTKWQGWHFQNKNVLQQLPYGDLHHAAQSSIRSILHLVLCFRPMPMLVPIKSKLSCRHLAICWVWNHWSTRTQMMKACERYVVSLGDDKLHMLTPHPHILELQQAQPAIGSNMITVTNIIMNFWILLCLELQVFGWVQARKQVTYSYRWMQILITIKRGNPSVRNVSLMSVTRYPHQRFSSIAKCWLR